MLRSSLVVTAALAALVVAAVEAAANGFVDTVDLEVLGNGKVKGTLRSASERETFRLELPQGSVVTAQAKRRGKGKLVPALNLQFGESTEADGTTRGRGSKLRSAALEQSGDHLLRVYGNGQDDGDYQLAFKVKHRTRWTGKGSSPPGSFALNFYFGAPAGAQAKVRLAPARGSGFVPALEGLYGPSFPTVLLSGASTSWIPLGPAGTYGVGFHDGGTEGGDWVCTVQLRIPRVPKSVIDISAAALTGPFGGTQQVYGAQVGPEGGIVDPPDLGGSLDGSSVSIPEGSLPYPVVITINEAGEIVPPDPDTGAGPTIQFGPSGTEFEEGLPATITIPYDPSQFNDPATELTVYVRNDETGEIEPVLPREDYDFSQYGLVSFPYPHFSSFAAAGSRPKSPTGNWVLAQAIGGPFTTVTWAEYVAAANVYVSPFGEGSSLDFRYQGSSWYGGSDGGTTAPSPPSVSPFATGQLYDSAYVDTSSDTDIFLYFGNDSLSLLRSARGDVWLHAGLVGTLPAVQLGIRRTEGDPTHLTLAGRWHMLVVSSGAGDEGTQASPILGLFAHGGRAMATLANDGTWRISGVSARRAESGYAVGTWTSGPGTIPGSATGGLDGDLYVEFPAPLGAGPGTGPETFRFVACAGGDVLVGTGGAVDGDATLIFLVRESANLKPSALEGTTTTFSYARETVDAEDATRFQRFRWITELADVTRTLPRALEVVPLQTVTYDVDAEGIPTVDRTTAGRTTGTWTLAANGAYSDSTGMVGAVSPHGDLFIALTADGQRFVWAFGSPGEKFQLLRN